MWLPDIAVRGLLCRLHSGNTRSLPQLPPILSSLMESQRAPTPAPPVWSSCPGWLSSTQWLRSQVGRTLALKLAHFDYLPRASLGPSSALCHMSRQLYWQVLTAGGCRQSLPMSQVPRSTALWRRVSARASMADGEGVCLSLLPKSGASQHILLAGPGGRKWGCPV